MRVGRQLRLLWFRLVRERGVDGVRGAYAWESGVDEVQRVGAAHAE